MTPAKISRRPDLLHLTKSIGIAEDKKKLNQNIMGHLRGDVHEVDGVPVEGDGEASERQVRAQEGDEHVARECRPSHAVGRSDQCRAGPDSTKGSPQDGDAALQEYESVHQM